MIIIMSITLRFTCSTRKIWSNIKRSENITTMITGLDKILPALKRSCKVATKLKRKLPTDTEIGTIPLF